jgi:hypothetical protein
MDQWRETLSRQPDNDAILGAGHYPEDLNLAAITLPLYVAHVTNFFLGAVDPLSFVLPKWVVWFGLKLVYVAFAAVFFDLMATTNGTARGLPEQQPSIRQWIDWWEINAGLNFAMANILYELLFSVVFINVAWFYLRKGRSSAAVALAVFCVIKWAAFLSWAGYTTLDVYSPIEFWRNLTSVWDPTQGGGALLHRAYI